MVAVIVGVRLAGSVGVFVGVAASVGEDVEVLFVDVFAGVGVQVAGGVDVPVGVAEGVLVGVALVLERYKTASPAKGGVKSRLAPPVTESAGVVAPVPGLNHSTARVPGLADRLTVTAPPAGR